MPPCLPAHRLLLPPCLFAPPLRQAPTAVLDLGSACGGGRVRELGTVPEFAMLPLRGVGILLLSQSPEVRGGPLLHHRDAWRVIAGPDRRQGCPLRPAELVAPVDAKQVRLPLLDTWRVYPPCAECPLPQVAVSARRFGCESGRLRGTSGVQSEIVPAHEKNSSIDPPLQSTTVSLSRPQKKEIKN